MGGLGGASRHSGRRRHGDALLLAGAPEHLLVVSAGKTTLLQLAVGLIGQTTGEIAVLDGIAPGSPEALDGIAFVAQDTPLLGLMIRRTVPAMAATAAAWVAVVVPSLVGLRPLIQRPITAIGAIAKGPNQGHDVPFNATVLNHWFQDAAGHHVGFDQLFQQAVAGNGGTPPSPDQFNAYLAQNHYSAWVSYRPNGWFWHFQTVEATGYAALAILLAVATVLVLRRRAI